MPHAEIASKQALFALQQLHAELSGKLQQVDEQRTKIEDDMKTVERTIKLLDPKYSLRAISIRRRKPNKWFKRGTIFRAVLDVLRTAEKPLSADEISIRLLQSKGIPEPAREQRLEIEGAVTASLVKNRGKIVQAVGDNPRLWSVLEQGEDVQHEGNSAAEHE